MSSSRWRVLTAYLPGIASVVNSFQSPEVQLAVYQSLIKALDEKTEAEEAQVAARSNSQSARGKANVRREVVSIAHDSELAYDLVDGENIHAMMGKS